MSRALSALLLLASCESGGGVDIVVPSMPGVAHVALYFSVGDDSNEPIAPKGFPDPIRPNNWWPLDEYSHLDVRDVTGSDVTFELARGDNGESKLSIAIVVGFDALMVPIAAAKQTRIEIPSDSLDRHILRLAPLSNTLLVAAWGPSPEPTQCVAYADATAPRIDMIVDPADPDCDGLLTGAADECVPNVYRGQARSPLQQVSCLVHELVLTAGGGVADGCVLGGPRCVDGEGPQLGCEASKYCIPGSVCRTCTTTTAGFACAANIETARVTGDLPTHLFCRVGVTSTGASCGDEMLAWPDFWDTLAGRTCFGDVKITRGAGWNTTVTAMLDGGPIDIAVSNLQPNCNFTVKVTGPIETGRYVAGLVASDLDNGRGIGVPILVTGDPQVPCGSPVACDLKYAFNQLDYTYECINAPIQRP